jgi:hypothetical protein
MLNREGVLRTSDEAFADEKLQIMMLPTNGSNQNEREVAPRLLPRAKACSEAEAGVW